jgi:cytoskeletal protein CcmA (bactofilin family)
MIGKKDDEDFNVGGNLNTIIGKGSSFQGTFKVNSTLRIDGTIKGNITISDSLVVGKDGVIDGEVAVRNAIIGGTLKGKLSATGKVVLEAKSVFQGELSTAKLVIDEGATFEGRCSMSETSGDDKKKPFSRPVEVIAEKKSEEVNVVK